MIQYRAGKWGLAFAFRVKGSVFPKAVAWALPCAIFSVILQLTFVRAGGKLVTEVTDSGIYLFGGFTSILGILIVFRSQQAYLRWWEGGTLLQQLRGEWFNAFSSCVAWCNYDKEGTVEFQHKLIRLMSMLYGAALCEVSEMADNTFEFIDLDGLDVDGLCFLRNAHSQVEIVLQWVQRMIVDAHHEGIVNVAPPILSRVFYQLGNGIVILNNARKLNDFPFPFPLAQMITVMLIVHWIALALVVATSVKSPAWAFFIVFAVVFAFWSIHFIGAELEMPFGDDDNDLPLHEMQIDLNQSLRDLLHDRARFPPEFHFDLDRHTRLDGESFDLDHYIEAKASLQRRATEAAVASLSCRQEIEEPAFRNRALSGPCVLQEARSSTVSSVPGALLAASEPLGSAQPRPPRSPLRSPRPPAAPPPTSKVEPARVLGMRHGRTAFDLRDYERDQQSVPAVRTLKKKRDSRWVTAKNSSLSSEGDLDSLPSLT